MSTTLYRLNEDDSIEEISVPGEHVQESLNAGYVPCKKSIELKLKAEADERERIKAEQAAKDAEAPPIEESDTNGSDELSNQEIRDAAEHAGIDGFATKRINTLMEELGYAIEAGTN